MQETSQSRRTILASPAVIVGLFMITVAPFLIQTSLERVLTELTEEDSELDRLA